MPRGGPALPQMRALEAYIIAQRKCLHLPLALVQGRETARMHNYHFYLTARLFSVIPSAGCRSEESTRSDFFSLALAREGPPSAHAQLPLLLNRTALFSHSERRLPQRGIYAKRFLLLRPGQGEGAERVRARPVRVYPRCHPIPPADPLTNRTSLRRFVLHREGTRPSQNALLPCPRE